MRLGKKVRVSVFCVALFSLQCATTSKPYVLSDAEPRLSEFQNTTWDPLKEEPRPVTNIGLGYVEDFLQRSNRIITILQMGERVIDQQDRPNPSQESIEQEKELIPILLDRIPGLITEIPPLNEDGKQIQENLQRDLSGPRQALLPEVTAKIASNLQDLAEYSTKGPVIYERLKQRYAVITGSSGVLDSKTLADEKEGSSDENEENPKEEDAEELQRGDSKKKQQVSQLAQERQSLLPKIQKLPKNFPASGQKLTVKEGDSERELTEEELQEREYNKQLNDGLLAVFRAEYQKNVPRLSHLTLNHPIPRVRAAGARALGRLKQGRITLEKSIQSDGFVVRPASYEALAEIGHRESLPVFLAGVKSEDEEIQAYSFLGLGKTRDPAGRELILSRGLVSTNPKVVSYSLRGLGYYQIPADLDLIQKHLSSDNKEIQEAALESLTIHNTPESLVVLENALVEYPNLVMPILEAIGKSKELAATFFLVRASQLYEDKEVLEKIGSLLVKRKAYGLYGMAVIREDRLRVDPNERAREVGIVRLGDVGRVHSKGKKRFVVRLGSELLEDVYYNMTFENRALGARQRYARGWIFGKKIQLIQIQKPYKKQAGELRNLETGKYQNLYDPSDLPESKP